MKKSFYPRRKNSNASLIENRLTGNYPERKQEVAMQKITPCIWFDHQALEAAEYYVSIFPDATIETVEYYPADSPGPEGKVMAVTFELFGQECMTLNGGPEFPLTMGISLIVNCETQQEVDYFWEKLGDGGKEVQCGWLTDRYGLSWQIVPVALNELMQTGDAEQTYRVMQAMLGMVKLDTAALQRAFDGE